jgi:hypothetical protein
MKPTRLIFLRNVQSHRHTRDGGGPAQGPLLSYVVVVGGGGRERSAEDGGGARDAERALVVVPVLLRGAAEELLGDRLVISDSGLLPGPYIHVCMSFGFNYWVAFHKPEVYISQFRDELYLIL